MQKLLRQRRIRFNKNLKHSSGQVVQDFNAATDVVALNGTGFGSFADVLSHSYQNDAYFVVQVDSDTAVWLNGGHRYSSKFLYRVVVTYASIEGNSKTAIRPPVAVS
ncbi:hypothetical protein ABIB82_005262 [Bradyrhizobium sp. i1.8.4]|uniref:hypothetical protein n=1 Tax=unclassified Bradyrhizobium TaxID=2631580 RepID=UPI003D19EB87